METGKSYPHLSAIGEAARNIIENLPGPWRISEVDPRGRDYQIQSTDGDIILEFIEETSGYYLSVRTNKRKRTEIAGISMTSDRTNLPTLAFYDTILFLKVLFGFLHLYEWPCVGKYSCFVETPYIGKFKMLSAQTIKGIEGVLELNRREGRAVVAIASGACSLYATRMTNKAILDTIGPSIHEFVSIRLWETTL